MSRAQYDGERHDDALSEDDTHFSVEPLKAGRTRPLRSDWPRKRPTTVSTCGLVAPMDLLDGSIRYGLDCPTQRNRCDRHASIHQHWLRKEHIMPERVCWSQCHSLDSPRFTIASTDIENFNPHKIMGVRLRDAVNYKYADDRSHNQHFDSRYVSLLPFQSEDINATSQSIELQFDADLNDIPNLVLGPHEYAPYTCEERQLPAMASTASISSLNISARGLFQPAYCVYPIDGQYGLIPRILFYGLLVFALATRNHEWLVVGALVSATTFAGAAAIHAICLAFIRPNVQAFELDAWPICLIVSTSCLIAAPLLNWSSTLRRLQSRPILVSWLILVGAGFVCSILAIDQVPKIFASQGEGIKLNCPLAPPLENVYLDDGFFGAWDCPNPCLDADKRPVFRTPTNGRILIGPDKSIIRGEGMGEFDRLNIVWIITFCFTVAQVAYTFIAGRRSPSQVRSTIFRLLVGKRTHEKRSYMVRYIVIGGPKATAVFVYIIAILITVLSPIVFVLNIIIGERVLADFETTEANYTIGQWSPLANLGLAIIGAVVGRYYRIWNSHIAVATKTLIYRGSSKNHIAWQAPKRNFSQSSASSKRNAGHYLVHCDRSGLTFKEHPRASRQGSFSGAVAHQFVHPLLRAATNVKSEWKELRDWLHDPFIMSAIYATNEKPRRRPRSLTF